MKKRYIVDLTDDERSELRRVVRTGNVRARRLTRAHILLLADEDQTDAAMAASLHVGTSTVERTRQKFVEGGLDWALSERPRPGAKRKVDGKQEAFLVALACSAPPTGHERWTLQLLADRLVAVGTVACISDETVRRTLKRGN